AVAHPDRTVAGHGDALGAGTGRLLHHLAGGQLDPCQGAGLDLADIGVPPVRRQRHHVALARADVEGPLDLPIQADLQQRVAAFGGDQHIAAVAGEAHAVRTGVLAQVDAPAQLPALGVIHAHGVAGSVAPVLADYRGAPVQADHDLV